MKKCLYVVSLIAFSVMSLRASSEVGHPVMPNELMVAIFKGDLQTVRRIIEHTPMLLVSIAQNDGGGWPFHIAARHNHLEIYAYLLDKACSNLGGRSISFS